MYFYFLILLTINCEQLLCVNLPNGCQEAFRNAAVNTHNTLRARHRAPALRRDSSIDSTALAWSQYLARNSIFKHSGTKGVGENLYALYGGSFTTSSQCAGKMLIFICCSYCNPD